MPAGNCIEDLPGFITEKFKVRLETTDTAAIVTAPPPMPRLHATWHNAVLLGTSLCHPMLRYSTNCVAVSQQITEADMTLIGEPPAKKG